MIIKMVVQKALITGGTGFVGSNLARRLVHDGWQVHLITRPCANLDQVKDIAGHLILHVHDGSTEKMHDIVAESKPDIIFHLASLFLSDHSSSDVDSLVLSNILFGTQLLEAMTAHGVFRIVNTGTSWQHYESKLYSPVNLYAAMKQAFEDILQYYVEAKGAKAITLKLFDTYGPNDPRPKLFHLLNITVKEGNTLAMSLGEQMIDLVYIDDVVQAFVMAADNLLEEDAQGHEIYGVSSGSPISLKELVKSYNSQITNQPLIKWGERPYRHREVMATCDTLLTLAGWSPRISLKAGVAKILSNSDSVFS